MTAERGSTTHGARTDDALAADVRGALGPQGSNREEWKDPEPPADDDRAGLPDPAADVTDYEPTEEGPAADLTDYEPTGDDDPADPVVDVVDDEERVSSDMDVAFDWNPTHHNPGGV